MSYTEVEEEGWFSQIAGAIKGIGIGILLFLIAPCLLFWNEGRAVDRYKTLAQGKGQVVSVATDKIDKANEGKLVHLSGQVKVHEKLTDPDFKVSVNGLSLVRDVEMYQWVEKKSTKTKKKVGGKKKKTTTYTYKKAWSDKLHNSDNFKEKRNENGKKRYNPKSMKGLKKESFNAKNATIGAFTLSNSIINQAKDTKDMTLTQEQFDAIPKTGDLKTSKLHSGTIYLGEDAANPNVGDVRVTFRVAEPGVLSIVSQQTGNSFKPLKMETGELELVSTGKKSHSEMFKAAEESNAMMTWILRFVGFILMFIGLSMVFRPLSVIADIIPFIGSIIGTMSSVVAFLIAAPISLMVIAMAWIAHRPLLGVALFVLVGGFVGGLIFLIKKNKQGAPSTAGGPSSMPPSM